MAGIPYDVLNGEFLFESHTHQNSTKYDVPVYGGFDLSKSDFSCCSFSDLARKGHASGGSFSI